MKDLGNFSKWFVILISASIYHSKTFPSDQIIEPIMHGKLTYVTYNYKKISLCFYPYYQNNVK